MEKYKFQEETFFYKRRLTVPRGNCILVPRGNNSLFYQPLDGLLLMFHDRVQVQERKLLERSIIDNKGGCIGF
jgi:hypothetical protein